MAMLSNIFGFGFLNISQPVMDPIDIHKNLSLPFVPVRIEHNSQVDKNGSRKIIQKDRICGVPGFCLQSAAETCSNIPLGKCSECSKVGSVILILLLSVLILAIIFGNLLVILVCKYLRKKKEASKQDIIRTSLAVADLFTGLSIIIITFPNFAFVINSSFDEIAERAFELHNSSVAIAGGIVTLFLYSLPIYHLILLGISRLIAIKWPMRYRKISSRVFYVCLVIVWFFSAVFSSFPSWFPDYFSFDFNVVNLFFSPSFYLRTNNASNLTKSSSDPTNFIKSSTDSSNFMESSSKHDLADFNFFANYSISIAIISLFLILGIPYAILTIVTISTAFVVHFVLRKSQKQFNHVQNTYTKQEIAAFKTVAIMQTGYTITLMPLGIVVALLYAEYFTCNTYSTAFMICCFLSLSNSLVNVLVYSIREKKFRATVREVFKNAKSSSLFKINITKTSTKNSINV